MGDSLQTALDRLDVYQTQHLPVVDDARQVLGSVSEQGCTQRAWKEINLHNTDLHHITVADLLDANIMAVQDTEPVTGLLVSRCVETHPWLPVTDSQGSLIGTLNRIDVIQAMLDGILSADPR